MLTPSAELPTLPLTPIPLVIYTRVSNDTDGTQRSCIEQEGELAADIAAYRGRHREPLEIIAALRDPNVSASRYARKDRPDWFALLNMIREGQVKVVAFWEMSRATRNLREWAEFAEIAEDAQLHVFLRSRLYDCTNPSDMAYLTNLVIRGIEEVGQGRERIQRNIRSQVEQGRPGGRPGFGLRSVYDKRTGALLDRVPDEEPWPDPDSEWTPAGLVREAARRVLAGESLWSIATEWNEKGIPSPEGKRWHTTVLKRILTSTSIMGKRTYKKVRIDEGGWKGVISEETFHQLQHVFSQKKTQGRNRDRSAGLKYYLSSVLKCGVCGSWVYPGKVATNLLSFRCSPLPGGKRKAGCLSRSIARTEEHVESLMVVELSRPDIMTRFERPVDEVQVARDKARIAELRSQEREAVELSLIPGPGRLTVGELMNIRSSLAQEREQIQARVDEAGGVGVPPLLHQVIDGGPQLVLERWVALSVEQKRSLLRDVTESVHLLPVGKVGRRKLLPSESVDVRFVGDPPFELLGG